MRAWMLSWRSTALIAALVVADLATTAAVGYEFEGNPLVRWLWRRAGFASCVIIRCAGVVMLELLKRKRALLPAKWERIIFAMIIVSIVTGTVALIWNMHWLVTDTIRFKSSTVNAIQQGVFQGLVIGIVWAFIRTIRRYSLRDKKPESEDC